MSNNLIYDIGANNGDDIPYYLMKADRVIAVEANPTLCQDIIQRFSEEINQGRLVVINAVIVDKPGAHKADFYISRRHHVLSQYFRQAPQKSDDFDRIQVDALTLPDIIKRHGDPFYVKIDIEHLDAEILSSLFESGIVPPFISAESHTIRVFAQLVAGGHYNSFKLVDGFSVSKIYRERLIQCHSTGKKVKYSFPFHSAGPFGNDVDGEWMTADTFIKLLALEGLGWKDIHGSTVEQASGRVHISISYYFWQHLFRRAKESWRQIVKKLTRSAR